MKKCKAFCKNHCFGASVLVALIGGFLFLLVLWLAATDWSLNPKNLMEFLPVFAIAYLPVSCFIIYPFVLTAVHLCMVAVPKWRRSNVARQWDGLTLVLGVVFNLLYWYVFERGVISYPILSLVALPLLALGVLGYIGLTYHPEQYIGWKKGICIVAMLLAVVTEFWWCWVCEYGFNIYLILLPINITLIALRTAINSFTTQ